MKQEQTTTGHNRKSRSKALAVALTPLLFAVAACTPSKHDAVSTTPETATATTPPLNTEVETTLATTTTVLKTPETTVTTSASTTTEMDHPTTVVLNPSVDENQYRINDLIEASIDEPNLLQLLPEEIRDFHTSHNMTFHQYKTEGELAAPGHNFISILSQSRHPVPGSTDVNYNFNVVYEDLPKGRDFKYIKLSTNDYGNQATAHDPELKGFRLLDELILSKDATTGEWVASGLQPDGSLGFIADNNVAMNKLQGFSTLLYENK